MEGWAASAMPGVVPGGYKLCLWVVAGKATGMPAGTCAGVLQQMEMLVGRSVMGVPPIHQVPVMLLLLLLLLIARPCRATSKR